MSIQTQTLDALESMLKMHDTMMRKVNHGASAYDAECLSQMNDAPLAAVSALKDAGRDVEWYMKRKKG